MIQSPTSGDRNDGFRPLQVIAADVVTGPYDVIAMAETASMDDLGNLVAASIQAIDGVTRTLTCPVIKF